MSPKHPLDDVDDGNPYGGNSPMTPDYQGGTRVIPGQVRPGAAPRLVEDPAQMRIGTTGRASIYVDRPVAPTDLSKLPVNPFTHVGAVPTKFAQDPRRVEGSLSREHSPEYVILAELKRPGWNWLRVSHWVQEHGGRGMIVSDAFLRQCAMLAHFGDPQAGKLLIYAQQTNELVRRAMQAAAQSARARLARSIGR